jgi:co-chaperonin GroES (HSP10)
MSNDTSPAAHHPALAPVDVAVPIDEKAVSNFGDIDLAKFTPLNGFLLVQRLTVAPRGPIIEVASDKRKEPTVARVVMSGRGELCERTGARKITAIPPGTRIIIDKYAGHDVKINGSNYVMLQPVEILGIEGGQESTPEAIEGGPRKFARRRGAAA